MSQSAKQKHDVSALYSNPEELGKVLFALTQPNNADLKQATILIHKFLEKPASIMPLVQQIEKSQRAEVRQVAAVYLREQIEGFYKKIPAEIKPKLKEFLIAKLLSMENRPERLAIGAAIASTAKFAFIDNEGWNELLMALEKASQPDQNVDLREVSYILWRNLVSFCGGALKKHFGKILSILQRGLKDEKSIKIQVESVKAIGIMVEFLENEKEVAIIEGFIPSMVAVIDKCLKKGDEDNVIAGMEVFNDLVESKIPVIHKHAEQLTKFNLKIAAAKDELPMTVRKQATNFATWMCKAKPKQVMKHGFLLPFLTLCINLVIESADEDLGGGPRCADDHDDGDHDEDCRGEKGSSFLSPLGIACDLLDEIFLNIPSEQCFPVAMGAIEKLLAGQQSNQRKAGYVVIAMMAEGCKEIMVKGDGLRVLLEACLKGIRDPVTVVRKCSLEAVSQICTHCNFDILQFHELLLPAIFKIFENDDEVTNVLERALSAMEMFIDSYDPNDSNDNTPSAGNKQFQLSQYLQRMMNVIGKCLDSNHQELQKQAISTMSSCAAAAKGDFNVYLPKVMQLLESLMQIDDADKMELRAEATQCLGSVASAVGIDSFKSSLPRFHQYVMDGLMDIDDSDIREASFMYFGDLANVMGPSVLKLESFEEMLNFILFVIEDDDGLMVELPDDGFGDAIPKGLRAAEDTMAAMEEEEERKLQEMDDDEIQRMMEEAIANEEEEDGAGDDDDDDDALQNQVGQLRTIRLNVTTGFMEEKAAAVHALTALIKNGGFAFLEHLEECWERLTFLWEYPHSLVKMSVAGCFHEFFTLIVDHALHDEAAAVPLAGDAKHRQYPWAQGVAIGFNDNVQRLIDGIFPLYVQAIRDEEDRDALNVVIDYLVEELKILGPLSISPTMEQLLSAINEYLKEETSCQQDSEPRTEDTRDIGTKHRWISDTVADLIATLAQLFGADFGPLFGRLLPNLLTFGRETRHPQDQAMVVGCIADCCSRLTDGPQRPNKIEVMNPFSDTVFKLALRVAGSEDVNMRQNALYCIGALSACCDTKSNLAHSAAVLQCIKTYLQLPADGERAQKLVRDNAVSALGKMLISEPQALPTQELLPIFLSALPLTCDFTENQYVYDVVMRFIVEQPLLIQSQIERALSLLGGALSDNDVNNDTKSRIVDCLKKICGDANIKRIVTNLAQMPKDNIMKAVSQ